jgi:hypothetical protein
MKPAPPVTRMGDISFSMTYLRAQRCCYGL